MVFFKQIPRKRFGQHWLIDESILTRIVRAADIQAGDRILEIGPGRGALTERLLGSQAELIHAIELDRDLVLGLKKRFSSQERFYLQEGDFLSSNINQGNGRSLNKVVANIPYNITSPLLDKLLGKLGSAPESTFTKLVLLMQKEVADRIIAVPGKHQFSAMSVRIQLLAHAFAICDVPPKCFKPMPKVDSKVVVLEPLPQDKRQDFSIERKVDTLLKKAFLARRKKLKNTLVGISTHSKLQSVADSLGISLDQRPQELSPTMWVKFAKALE